MSPCASPLPLPLCSLKSRIQRDTAETNGSASETMKHGQSPSGMKAIDSHRDLCGMEPDWTLCDLPGTAQIPYRSESGHAPLLIHGLHRRRTGRPSANEAPFLALAMSYRPIHWGNVRSVTPRVSFFSSSVSFRPYHLPYQRF